MRAKGWAHPRNPQSPPNSLLLSKDGCRLRAFPSRGHQLFWSSHWPLQIASWSGLLPRLLPQVGFPSGVRRVCSLHLRWLRWQQESIPLEGAMWEHVRSLRKWRIAWKIMRQCLPPGPKCNAVWGEPLPPTDPLFWGKFSCLPSKCLALNLRTITCTSMTSKLRESPKPGLFCGPAIPYFPKSVPFYDTQITTCNPEG